METRSRAQAVIMSGSVYVNGERVTKAGARVSVEANVEIRGKPIRYVSRGGLKLEHALNFFGINPAGCVCMDVGASTGGFTDCLLQHGASRVYAVDVGYGQLDWKLRKDHRVVVLEKRNIRYLPREAVSDPIELATIDTSFISLKLVIPSVTGFLKKGAITIALIKPQFEAGRKQVGKGGVVRDPAVHDRVCSEIRSFMEDLGFDVLGITPSPILGPRGNREFFIAGVWKPHSVTTSGSEGNGELSINPARLNNAKKADKSLFL
ncbi:TlyA family RNA methyltransferase [Thermodesulforhabdus norvegica]|uniref:TlyA family RNA methyltransferase n=1 Tax=Thermodesulforhabdus norvegica TaxID=39841 RepID=UPI001FDFBAF4|nr:TlyA family RNA methyltransferase [Thermodesulforhabdus norvegica]